MTALAPATRPRAFGSERLLAVDPARGVLTHHRFAELPALLTPGDLVVVNDAATLPSALCLTSHDAELRLAAREPSGEFVAVALGAGTFRLPTEARGPAPSFTVGERVASGALMATITAVDRDEPRLLRVRFELDGAALWAALYAAGRAISYSYLEQVAELWDVNHRFAARPWAFETPSAALPITFEVLGGLRRRGVELGFLTHAAGISSTGAPALDRRLPFPERYEIPDETAARVAATRARGGRVVAVGTTVVRALESSALEHGTPRGGVGEARLVLGPGFRPRAVDGLLTGMHEPGTSHFALLNAFAPRPLLEAALAEAGRAGYLQHEFGDACLILPR
ncbi:MAG TPA: S-adenosylmethionine:tRNA ribosyltransferase-isomerase [Polyangiaceae bacterium]|nr:S-adenosylmethionine:tRNA ribosyltransferase-isomerase [Polyangiaceae bacterium]